MTQRPNPVPPPRRVVVAGSVIAEVVMSVTELPRRGGEVRAADAVARAGGGYHVLVAARRAGLEAALAGLVGTGPMAQVVARAMLRDGIPVLLPSRQGEQGFSVVLAEPQGSTTRVASPGVESQLSEDDLRLVRLCDDDVAYLSAQDLLDPVTGAAIAHWCGSPAGLGSALLVLDPGPLVSDVADEILDAVLARTDVLAVGLHEIELLSGLHGDPTRALPDLADLLAPEGIVLLRRGEGRYALHERDGQTYEFPGDEPGPQRLREVGHLLRHLAELSSARVEPADGVEDGDDDTWRSGQSARTAMALLATD